MMTIRLVGGSPRKTSIESQVRRRRTWDTPQATPTSCLDGPMEPAPTEPVGAPDTSVSASAGGRLGYNWEYFSNQAAFSGVMFHCVVQNFDYSILPSKNTISSPLIVLCRNFSDFPGSVFLVQIPSIQICLQRGPPIDALWCGGGHPS